MTKIFKKFSNWLRLAVSMAAVGIVKAQSALAFAQGENYDQIGQTILERSATTMNSLVVGVANVVRAAIGLGALVTLVIAIFNVIKGDREAAQKIGYWVVGLALGFVLISVVVNVISRGGI